MPELIIKQFGQSTNSLFAGLWPYIASWAPGYGESVSLTITGSGFTGATGVKINGAACTSVVVVSDTSITCTTPASFTAGYLTVTTPGGTAIGSSTFTPVLTLIKTPASGNTTGLVSEWLCNDFPTSTTLADAIGGNPMTVGAGSSPYFATDSAAEYFNAVQPTIAQYAKTAGNVLTGQGAFSVETYAYIPFNSNYGIPVGSAPSSGSGTGFMKYPTGSGSTVNFTSCLTGQTSWSSGGYISRVTSGALSSGLFHLVATFDPSVGGGTLRLYVNGSQVAQNTGTGNLATMTGQYWGICSGGNSSWTADFDGKVYFARVYNVALTSAQVTAAYNNL